MKLQIPDISNQNDLTQGIRFTSIALSRIVDMLNGNIGVTDNLDVAIISGVTFSIINSEVTVAHGLDRTPVGFIPIIPSVAMNLYNGVTAWTNSNMYLKSDTIGNCSILVF